MAKKNSFWSRFWNIFRAKSHKALDKIEDPIEALELKTRDLSGTLTSAVEGLAKVKAVEIKHKKRGEKFRAKADEHMKTAKKLRTGLQNGGFEGRTEEETKADIIIMLNNVENMNAEAESAERMQGEQAIVVKNLEVKIKKTKTLLEETKRKTSNLKAMHEAAAVNKEVSKELSGANLDGVKAQIDEIENRIRENNAEAEAWESIDESFQDDEDRINEMLNQSSVTEDSTLLADFLSEDESTDNAE